MHDDLLLSLDYRTLAQLACVTYRPSGLIRAWRSSVGALSAIVNDPFQWSVDLTLPNRSRLVSTQSTSKFGHWWVEPI